MIEEAQRKGEDPGASIVLKGERSENTDGDAENVDDHDDVTVNFASIDEVANADQGPTSLEAP